MRVELWDPNRYDIDFENISMERLIEAANVVANEVRSRCPIGTISRPMYKTGKYADQPWTARDAGQLKKSIRVTRLKTRSGKAFSKKRNIRVYAGNFLAYYANIVEYSKPFMRPGVTAALPEVRSIIGIK